MDSKIKRKITVLITAGPTKEYLDPVRFISNDSSGKLGYSLAALISRDKNARVILVSGQTSLPRPGTAKFIGVTTALQMRKQVLKYYRQSDIMVFTAAVSDWRPEHRSGRKIKKSGKGINVKMVQNPDILREISARKGRASKVIAGFALESENLLRNALKKMELKNLDIIAANSPRTIGKDEFGGGYIVISPGKIIKVGRMKKEKFAGLLWNAVKERYFGKILFKKKLT